MLRLKELRNERNITQQVVANLLNITRAAYSNIENGKRDPDTATLIQLADYFNVSIDYLVGRVDIPYTEEYIYKAEEDLFNYCNNINKISGFNFLKYRFCENLPPYYKDPILRKQNYSLEIRAKILTVLKIMLNEIKESISRFKNTREKSELSILDNINLFINYHLQKAELKKPPIYGIDHEGKERKFKLTDELHQLHQLLHDGIDLHLKAKYDDRFKLYFEPEGILEYAFEDDSQMFQGRLRYTFGIYHPTNRDFLLLEQIEGDLINKVVDLKDEICISFIMGLINTNLKIPQKNIGNKIDIFINYNGQYKELEKRYGNKEPCFEFCDGLPKDIKSISEWLKKSESDRTDFLRKEIERIFTQDED